MNQALSKILNFVWKILGGIAVIFAGIGILANFLFTPKLFQNLTRLFSLKVITTITLILVVSAGAVFTWQYFWAPEEKVVDETADWQTYRNEEYGFEIKYSNDWSLNKISKKMINFIPPGKEAEFEYFRKITIIIYSNFADLPNNEGRLEFNNWIGQQIKPGIFRNKKEITIGAENYKGVEVQDLGIVNFRNVLFSHNSTVYSIYIDEDSPEMPIFNQMLSTFRFLE